MSPGYYYHSAMQSLLIKCHTFTHNNNTTTAICALYCCCICWPATICTIREPLASPCMPISSVNLPNRLTFPIDAVSRLSFATSVASASLPTTNGRPTRQATPGPESMRFGPTARESPSNESKYRIRFQLRVISPATNTGCSYLYRCVLFIFFHLSFFLFAMYVILFSLFPTETLQWA